MTTRAHTLSFTWRAASPMHPAHRATPSPRPRLRGPGASRWSVRPSRRVKRSCRLALPQNGEKVEKVEGPKIPLLTKHLNAHAVKVA